ncbi:hypothetical protein [Pendulispora albinea]|uniref:Uncharacterized protein n=1 Tax=Pendulispora albinea TaxID=2741071 RepID=A0ABZ2LPE7_9BACT
MKTMTRTYMGLALGVMAMTGFSAPAHAQEALPRWEKCPVPAGAAPALANIDAGARARFIREHLRRDAGNARTWSLGWAAASVAMGSGGLTLGLLESDRDKRIGNFIWAGTSLIMPLRLLISPLHVMGDSRALEDDASRPPEGDAAREPDGCSHLARAEAFLERDAAQEAFGTAWYTHAMAIGFSAGLGATLGYALDDWSGNALAAGIGIAISELQIWTQPTGAVRARDRYLAGNLVAPDDARATSRWILAPLAQPRAYGLAVGVSF